MFKGKTPLIVAAVLGLVAGLLAYNTVRRQQQSLLDRWQTVPIVVANRDLVEGTAIDLDMVARSEMPSQFVTSSVLRPEQVERVLGQRLAVPLKAGDPIQWNQFRTEGQFERLSSIVRTNGRAISLGISGPNGVAGWVRPSDHVDILGTFQDPKDDKMVSVTLMQDVVVLATGEITSTSSVTKLDKRERDYSTVTLWVMPEEAEILSLAAELGSLRLTLRNATDLGSLTSQGRTTRETLFSGERLQEQLKIRRRNAPSVEYLDNKKKSDVIP
jgi:pilus assembly protein CpaB